MTTTPELRLFDAIVRAVMADGEEWSTRIISAAVDALVDGLDSPSLAELAGQAADDDQAATERLLIAACEELGIPYPPRREHWEPREIDGRRWTRLARDSIRFSIEPSEDTLNDFELYIFINEVDVTLGLGAGLDPIAALGPSNQFEASDLPRRISISACSACGEVGCDPTWVDIWRDGETVQWEWVDAVPNGSFAGASFNAVDYDAEVARIRADVQSTTAVDRPAMTEQMEHDVFWAPPVPIADHGRPASPRDPGDERRAEQAQDDTDRWESEHRIAQAEVATINRRAARGLLFLALILVGCVILYCGFDVLAGYLWGFSIEVWSRPAFWVVATAGIAILGTALWFQLSARRAEKAGVSMIGADAGPAMREPTSSELRVIKEMVNQDFEGSVELAGQIEGLRVASIDSNGSLRLAVSGGRPAQVRFRVPVEAEYDDHDGVVVHVLVHVVNGYLDELEVYREDGGRVVIPIGDHPEWRIDCVSR